MAGLRGEGEGEEWEWVGEQLASASLARALASSQQARGPIAEGQEREMVWAQQASERSALREALGSMQLDFWIVRQLKQRERTEREV